MKHLFIILFVAIFCSCGTGENQQEQTKEKVSVDSVHIPLKGVIANLDTTQYFDTKILSIPLYTSPSADAVVDSVFYLRHFGTNGSFYTIGKDSQMVILAEKDFFRFYLGEQKHQGLVFSDFRNNRFQIMANSRKDERWMNASDLPDDFIDYQWSEFLDTLHIDSLYIKPTNIRLKAYKDTLLKEKVYDIKRKNDEYFQVISVEGTLIQVVKHEVKEYGFTEENWPNYYLPTIQTEEDTTWIRAINDGEPTIEIRKVGASDMNASLGVGILHGEELYTGNIRVENPLNVDSINIYDGPNGKFKGSIPVNGKKIFFRKARYYEDDTRLKRWGSGMDVMNGLSSWEYIKVYEKKKNYLRLYQSKFNNRPFWVNRKDLGEDVDYYSYDQYYLHFLNGNEGWGKGYRWCGDHDFLYAKPDNRSERIYEFPAGGNIFLTGRRDGEWAEVKVKELEHQFGEIYYSGNDHRWHMWIGWIRLSDEHGHGNLDEIILGC